ncbi:hypothetical protein Hypma_008326 [Hypsizygus marmoreus]|uniref:Uncharacterized protein n=1 Tax=Hypsizygus marmoreus TaxID=39966 RepID=A0A369JY32_HYPMA|nr:hypothetical protein Hypma_008326 [Hypsizygus marmoreus]
MYHSTWNPSDCISRSSSEPPLESDLHLSWPTPHLEPSHSSELPTPSESYTPPSYPRQNQRQCGCPDSSPKTQAYSSDSYTAITNLVNGTHMILSSISLYPPYLAMENIVHLGFPYVPLLLCAIETGSNPPSSPAPSLSVSSSASSPFLACSSTAGATSSYIMRSCTFCTPSWRAERIRGARLAGLSDEDGKDVGVTLRAYRETNMNADAHSWSMSALSVHGISESAIGSRREVRRPMTDILRGGTPQSAAP